MTKIFITLAFGMFVHLAVFAQEKPVKFTVTVSTDSILLDNYFEVKFTLENADGKNFEAPAFDNFDLVSGPNFSTSMSIVNGEMTQSMTITYYLEPRNTGSFYILPASVEAKGKILETAPLEVLVYPNPDGIKQTPYQKLDLFQWGDPFNYDGDFLFPKSTPGREPIQPQPKPEETPKKKRKTTRI